MCVDFSTLNQLLKISILQTQTLKTFSLSLEVLGKLEIKSQRTLVNQIRSGSQVKE
jgi:hypothetical protein